VSGAGLAPHGHETVWELLPWHAKGTLEAPDAVAVEDHLTRCHSCREELARCRQLAASLPDRDTWAPDAADVARLWARIEALEPAAARATRGRRAGGLGARLAVLLAGPSPLRWALAAQAALIVLLGAALLWPALAPRPDYHTLSRPEQSPDGPRVRIVFAEDATEPEMRALLHQIGGAIVGGPSTTGVYTVRIARGSADGPTRALEAARAHPKVRLAEPVAP
jgi:anti-sigma factor RsiW